MDMLKVMLADDERLILKGFHKLIDWERHGLTIVGEAYNGIDLLAGIEQLKPDIVISDIVMPGMTGIQVIKQIKQRNLDTQVIFISAFRDFDYAQEALALGAADYLVKPVDQVKLEESLWKATAAIRNASQSKRRFSRLAELEQQQMKAKEERFVEKLLDGAAIPLTDQAEWQHAFGKWTADTGVTVIAIEREDIMSDQPNWQEKDWRLLQFAVHNIMENTLLEYESGWVVMREEAVCAVVRSDQAEEVLTLADTIRLRLLQFLKLRVAPGIGGCVELKRMSVSYSQALAAASYRFFLPEQTSFSHHSLPMTAPGSRKKPDEIEREMLQVMASTMNERLKQLCAEWQDAVASEAWGNREQAIGLGYSLLLMVSRQAAELGLRHVTSSMEGGHLLGRLRRFHSLSSMSECIAAELQKLMSYNSSQHVSKEYVELATIKAYISEHYREEISLESMAALAFMNASYFSTFFKKHTGQNFKQYVTELRMKEAHRLLRESDMMIYEIAEHVGYNNSRQFSDMFRKYYGTLPNDYRLG
jgi:two-component system response regulator YesN